MWWAKGCFQSSDIQNSGSKFTELTIEQIPVTAYKICDLEVV